MAHVVGQMIARAEQCDADRPTGIGKSPGSHKSIATVVAGPAENDHRPLGPAQCDLACDGSACVPHQLRDSIAGSDREAISFSRLANIQQRCLAI
jgi:hypothetical protein